MNKFYLSYVFLFFVALPHISNAYQLYGEKWEDGSYDYKINPIGVDNSVDYSAFTNTVIDAAALWSSVESSNVGVNFTGVTNNTSWGANDGENIIVWKTEGWSGSVIGVSTMWYSGSTILDSDIKLNTAFSDDSRLSQLVAHEVGHSLGIAHTKERGESYSDDEYNAIMYWQLHTQKEINSQDKCAITAIYPVSESCDLPTEAGYYECSECLCCLGERGDSSVSVSISNNIYTYDGAVKNVTITTTPSDIEYSVAYYNEFAEETSAPTNVGVYDVIINITEEGYENEAAFFGILTIEKKSLTVKVIDTTVMYGQQKPEFKLACSGFINGENIEDIDILPNIGENLTWPLSPNNYDIELTGGSDNNYNLISVNGTLTVVPAMVDSVILENNLCIYNGSIQEAILKTYPENVNTEIKYYDSLNQQIEAPSTAGYYYVETTINDARYVSNSFTSILMVDKAPLTVCARDTFVLVGHNIDKFELGYSGFVNNETIDVIEQEPNVMINDVAELEAGIYPIIIENGIDDNYELLYKQGTLEIIQTYLINVVAGNNGMVISSDGDEPAYNYAYEIIEQESTPEFTAIPDEGYVFMQWDNGSVENPISFSSVTEDVTVTALFEKASAIDLKTNSSKIIMYPNQVSSGLPFSIKIDNNPIDGVLVLSDMRGRAVDRKTNVSNIVLFSGLKQGIYQMHLISGKTVTTSKLLVQ